ncbi:MAG: EamA family transporter [Deinococcales bacterium]
MVLLAIFSACFAALTAIFAKIGVAHVDSDFATLLRTCIVVLVLAPIIWLTGKWRNPFSLPSALSPS